MKAKFIYWLTSTSFWHWLLIQELPFIRMPYYTRFEGDKFVEGYRVLSPGQFLLCIDEKKLTTLLVPGFVTHAAFVTGNCLKMGGIEYEVAEMTHRNFSKSYWFTICKESSRVFICDCLDWDSDFKSKMLGSIRRFYGALYDIKFKFDVTSLYCSELIYQLDRVANNPGCSDSQLAEDTLKGRMQVDISDFAGIGQEYISPDGLLFGKNVRILWDSDGEFSGLLGPEVEAILKSKGKIK